MTPPRVIYVDPKSGYTAFQSFPAGILVVFTANHGMACQKLLCGRTIVVLWWHGIFDLFNALKSTHICVSELGHQLREPIVVSVSSLVAPLAVVTTARGATYDDKVVIMTTFDFQWCLRWWNSELLPTRPQPITTYCELTLRNKLPWNLNENTKF